MLDKKTNINLLSRRTLFILITFLCMGLLFSCSAEVSGPDLNFSGDGFDFGHWDFTVRKPFTDEIPVESHIRINIDAINGEVVVTGQSDADRVVVTADLLVSSDTLADADLHIKNLEIQVIDTADEIYVQTVHPENTGGRSYKVNYDIIVPDNFEVLATQINGHMAIIDIQNSVEVSNKNGDVLLSDIVGGITADVDNGSIEGTVILPVDEAIDWSINNGSLELSIPTFTSAALSATIGVVGDIIVSDLDIADSLSTPKALSGTLGEGEGSITLSTVNGKIEVIGFD